MARQPEDLGAVSANRWCAKSVSSKPVSKKLYRQNAKYSVRIILGVSLLLATTKQVKEPEFWLFHDVEEEEIVEIRKFIDPDLDLSSLKGFDKLLDKLNHLIE